MSLFSQLFHRFSTGSTELTTSGQMAELQVEHQALRDDFAALRLEHQELTEKTRRNLESYRARSQPRKDGKFATQEPRQSTQDGGLMESPTHAEIEQLARSQGIIR